MRLVQFIIRTKRKRSKIFEYKQIQSAIISIFVPEADNNPMTISVELDVEKPEAPAVVSAREFWESSYYKPYWDWHAPTDVVDVVKFYRFPRPYIHGG